MRGHTSPAALFGTDQCKAKAKAGKPKQAVGKSRQEITVARTGCQWICKMVIFWLLYDFGNKANRFYAWIRYLV